MPFFLKLLDLTGELGIVLENCNYVSVKKKLLYEEGGMQALVPRGKDKLLEREELFGQLFILSPACQE